MISARICRVGMNEDTQATMVEHQPRHQRREDLPGKCDLKHRAVTRADPNIMPAAELDEKALADPGAQLLGGRSRSRRII